MSGMRRTPHEQDHVTCWKGGRGNPIQAHHGPSRPQAALVAGNKIVLHLRQLILIDRGGTSVDANEG